MNFFLKVLFKCLFVFIVNETSFRPKKKLLTPSHAKEMEHRFGKKMVKPIKEKRAIHKFEGELFPTLAEDKIFSTKKYYFEKINDYHDERENEHNRMLKENLIMNTASDNNTNTNKADFTKHFYENISNSKLLGVTFTKDSFNALRKKSRPKLSQQDEYLKNSKNVWKHLEGKKLANLKTEQENLQRDIDYVTSLNDWASKTEYKSFRPFNI